MLRVPQALQPWLDQPGVSVQELIEEGSMSLPDIRALIDDGGGEAINPLTVVFPVHVV